MVIIPFRGRQGAPEKAKAPLADVVALFLTDLQLAGRQLRTREGHRQELRRYGRWLNERGAAWEAATEDDTLDYARTRASLGESARAATMCSLRVFYAWAVKRHYLAASPAAHLVGPSRSTPTPQALTRADIRRLVAYLQAQEGLRARRDEALCLTALYTGLRAAELARLRWPHVDLDERAITIHLSKMNHGRAVSIHVDAANVLRAWKTLQNLGPDAPVFTSTGRYPKAAPITAERVGKIMRQIKVAAQIEDFHTHRLRHSFATWTLRESKDLFAVSKALGHKQLKQTEIYVGAALDIEAIDAAVSQLPGLSSW